MIHYFLEGEIPTFCHTWPGQLIEWNSHNLPYEDYPILEKYRDEKKWSVLSDFVRRWALLKFGGIYLDCDVEIIKPIDTFYDYECFVCMEGPPVFGNMAVSGGHKGNKHLKVLLDMFLDVIEGRRVYGVPIEVACSPWVVTDYLKELKGAELEEIDLFIINDFDGLKTIPKACFYPYNWNEEFTKEAIKPNTYGIHHWQKNWK